MQPSKEMEEVKEHLDTLIKFIHTAPGRLPSRVTDAIATLEQMMPATVEHEPEDIWKERYFTLLKVRPDLIGDVRAFGEKFGLPLSNTPHLLEQDDWMYRFQFLEEEMAETFQAHQARDLAGVADGLIDLIYVAIGTLQLMGIPVAEGWREVQRANMAKERTPSAEESKRGHAWDIRKPPGWEPPDWRRVLQDATDNAYHAWLLDGQPKVDHADSYTKAEGEPTKWEDVPPVTIMANARYLDNDGKERK